MLALTLFSPLTHIFSKQVSCFQWHIQKRYSLDMTNPSQTLFHRAETEAEKNLKEEIENLKREVEKENDNSLHDRIVEKEKELDQLSHDLDDKLRFSQKSVERPGSGAGRVGGGTGFLQERPPSSQSGSFDESRSVDFSERPRSRGDSWMRGGDDRRGGGGGGGGGFGGGSGSGRDRGFMGNRDFGRSNSRERW